MNERAKAIAEGWIREDLRRNDDAPDTPLTEEGEGNADAVGTERRGA
jgi:hypothetical protein